MQHFYHIITTPYELDIAKCTKFDDCSFSRFRDIIDAPKSSNASRDLTTPFSGMVRHSLAKACYDQRAYQI